MTESSTAKPGPVQPAPASGWPSALRWMSWAILALSVVSAVRMWTGATDLTSAGTISAALSSAVPIAMAGLGGLWSERAGVVNIGLEGMLILGTFGAGWIGWQHGPWAGVLAAVLLGALGGLVHAIATITFGVDHIVSGVAVNILAAGGVQFLASQLLTGTPGGGETQSPTIASAGTFAVPGIGGPLADLEAQGWFLVSDAAGILGGLTTRMSPLTILAIIAMLASAWILWRTRLGLRIRACGEEPYAAEALGVNVYLYKYVAVTTSGALAGFGGAFLAIAASNLYREGQTGGRGYIGLAAMIFGNWRPSGLATGAGLFGFMDAMQLRSDRAVHAMLILVAILAVILAIRAIIKRRFTRALTWLVAGAVMAAWFFSVDKLPSQVTYVAPYLTTLLVLAFAAQRLRMPKADGQTYRRGDAR